MSKQKYDKSFHKHNTPQLSQRCKTHLPGWIYNTRPKNLRLWALRWCTVIGFPALFLFLKRTLRLLEVSHCLGAFSNVRLLHHPSPQISLICSAKSTPLNLKLKGSCVIKSEKFTVFLLRNYWQNSEHEETASNRGRCGQFWDEGETETRACVPDFWGCSRSLGGQN